MQQDPLNQVSLSELKTRFEQTKIVILGDVMLDAYIIGKINRISPEAPIPVVEVKSKEHRLGGAANVALNVKSLGANPILCCVRGNDTDGERLNELMEAEGIPSHGVFIDHSRPTTVKTRIIGNGKQVVRVDEESLQPISSSLDSKINDFLKQELTENSVLLIQDYNKGLLTEEMIRSTIALAKRRKIPVLVDPKKENFSAYKGVDIFKPNRKEVEEGLDVKFDPSDATSVEDMIWATQKKLEAKHVMVTLSEHGVAINQNDEVLQFPAFKRNIVDVSGAGDTVISVAALALASKLELDAVALLSNLGGGLVCEHIGVVPLSWESLENEIRILQNSAKNSPV